MRITPINVRNNYNFGHKILIDIGASNPKGSCKVRGISEDGREIFKSSGYLNTTVKGFRMKKDEETGKRDNGQADFITKLDDVIYNAHRRILAREKNGKIEFAKDENGSDALDRQLTGVAVFVPGTTFTNCQNDRIAFIPNLKNTKGESLVDIDFKKYEEELRSGEDRAKGLDINQEHFDFIVTKDLGGAGLAIAKILAQKGELKIGDYIMGVMTGGGFGSVDIKVKGDEDTPIVEFETSESSSYLTGNTLIYQKINSIFGDVTESESPAYEFNRLKEEIGIENLFPVLEKLGRQGVSVKSHLKCYLSALNLPVSNQELDEIIELAQKVGDARLVSNDIMYLPVTDEELYQEVKACPYFKEVDSGDKAKYAFSINHDLVDDESVKKARIHTVNDYANSVSLISINKINDCINKVYLVGPFAQGLNRHIQENQEEYGVRDLPSLILQKIETNTDKNHADLPSTRRLMKLYDFKVICDPEINFPDNTFAGDVLLDDDLKFTPNRGSWFSIPLKKLAQNNK
ncbi:MAG: hypothetical protein IJ003_06640 [Candidatus Gastranaerophilales bacterium]|nr:hypothetical protein [Candidatus Gastranaerophilales bacterium]